MSVGCTAQPLVRPSQKRQPSSYCLDKGCPQKNPPGTPTAALFFTVIACRCLLGHVETYIDKTNFVYFARFFYKIFRLFLLATSSFVYKTAPKPLGAGQ